jgi:hypothetical protein
VALVGPSIHGSLRRRVLGSNVFVFLTLLQGQLVLLDSEKGYEFGFGPIRG